MMPFKDPERRRAWSRRYKANNKAKFVAWARKRAAIIKAEIRRYKSKTPCKDCRKKYPYYVMDFDHVRGKKAHAVSSMLRSNRSLPAIWAEIEKCDLVCANCHRIRTQAQAAARNNKNLAAAKKRRKK
jgi:hypothetical protein